MNPSLRYSTRVAVTYRRRQLRGHVAALSPRDIDVMLVEPHFGLSAGRHIPLFPIGDPTDEGHRRITYFHEGELTRLGRATAEELVVELYRVCAYYEEHRASLSQLYRRAFELAESELASRRGLDEAAFRAARQRLRRQRRRGGLAANVYQRRLLDLKSRLRCRAARAAEIHRLVDDYAQKQLALELPADLLRARHLESAPRIG